MSSKPHSHHFSIHPLTMYIQGDSNYCGRTWETVIPVFYKLTEEDNSNWEIMYGNDDDDLVSAYADILLRGNLDDY